MEELQLLPGVDQGLAQLASLPAHLIVISNQGGIGMGLFTEEAMSAFNDALRATVERAGARLDGFYFCPHIEPKNLPPGEASCSCSKPSPAMLLEAAAEFGIELGESFMVGDKISDVAAGDAAGCKTVLIGPGKPDEFLPDAPGATYKVANFREATRLLLACFGHREPGQQA